MEVVEELEEEGEEEEDDDDNEGLAGDRVKEEEIRVGKVFG